MLIIASLLAGCVPKKYLNYNEIKNDLTHKNFSTILIVSTGTSGTNFFLENLSDELNNRLKDRQIKTVYYHLGNNQSKANELFNDIIAKTKYDAILQFAQLDETNNPIVLTYGTGMVPFGNGSYADYSYLRRNIRFKQKFLMRYFDFSDMSKSLVDVNLDLNMDFINPGDYKKLSDQIIHSLRIQ